MVLCEDVFLNMSKIILDKCHGSAYGGHHAGDRTAHKVLQSDFYWPTLFKDAIKVILSCDQCATFLATVSPLDYH